MDNLTHSLVGLFLARAGLRRATTRGTAILVLGANAPDFDAVSWFGGPATYLHWHRHITHSLLALPAMALLTVAIVRLAGQKPVRWRPAFLIAMIAVASHLLLDLTNIYGVRLLLPFSAQWFHWDLTPVIDFTIWAILFLGVAAPALGRLVGAEIGERRRETGGGWAIAALLLLFAYDSARSLAHGRAVAEVEARQYNGQTPRRTGAFPRANPMAWTGIAELRDAVVMAPVDLRHEFRPQDGTTYYKAERTPAVETARLTFAFGRVMEFAQWPIWVTEPTPGGKATRVRLVDLRFGTPEEPGFAAVEATVDDRLQVSDTTFGGIRPQMPR